MTQMKRMIDYANLGDTPNATECKHFLSRAAALLRGQAIVSEGENDMLGYVLYESCAKNLEHSLRFDKRTSDQWHTIAQVIERACSEIGLISDHNRATPELPKRKALQRFTLH